MSANKQFQASQAMEDTTFTNDQRHKLMDKEKELITRESVAHCLSTNQLQTLLTVLV